MPETTKSYADMTSAERRQWLVDRAKQIKAAAEAGLRTDIETRPIHQVALRVR